MSSYVRLPPPINEVDTALQYQKAPPRSSLVGASQARSATLYANFQPLLFDTDDGRTDGRPSNKLVIVTITPATPLRSEIIIRTDKHLAYPASKAGTLSALASQFLSRLGQRL